MFAESLRSPWLVARRWTELGSSGDDETTSRPYIDCALRTRPCPVRAQTSLGGAIAPLIVCSAAGNKKQAPCKKWQQKKRHGSAKHNDWQGLIAGGRGRGGRGGGNRLESVFRGTTNHFHRQSRERGVVALRENSLGNTHSSSSQTGGKSSHSFNDELCETLALGNI